MPTSAPMSFTSTCGGSVNATLAAVMNPVTGLPETNISQLCSTDSLNSTCFNGGTLPGMQMYTYEAIVVLSPACDTWTMGWSTCCRNPTVNVPTSNSDGVYIQATMNSATQPCNNSPQFTAQPIPYVCINQPVSYSYGVVEPDGDSLVYSLIAGLESAILPLLYGGGYTAAVPITGMTIDSQTGQLNFTPTVLGNFIVVVMVEEFDSNGNLLGTVMRDVQFVVQNCVNIVLTPPTTMGTLTGQGNQIGPMAVELCEGSQMCVEFTYSDPDLSDTITVTSNNTAVLPGSTFTTVGTNPVTATLCWTAQPGSPTFNAVNIQTNDGACPIAGIASSVVEVHVITSTYAGPDQTICGPQAASMTGTGGSQFTWTVLSGDPMNVPVNFSCDTCASVVADPAVTTTYELISNLSGNCVNRDTVTVNVVPFFFYSMTQSSTTSCLLEPVNVDITQNTPGAYTYQWSPGTFLNSTTVEDPIITATAPGTYTYAVVITSPQGCVQNDTLSIVVASAYTPSVIASVSDSSIICGDTVLFNVDLGGGIPATCGPSLTTACAAPSSQQTIGSATGANTTTSWPAPYGNWYRNARHQFLFTAAELNAMGFIGGKITELSWEVTAINGTSTYNAYQIYMGCTGTTQLTSWESGLTQVMAPQNITISTGWNTQTLTTAYEWDGVSNLVIEVCYNNLAVTYTQNSTTPWTTTGFTSSIYYYSDAVVACGNSLINGTSTNRPITRFTTCPTVPDPLNYTYSWSPAAIYDDPTMQSTTGLPLVSGDYIVTVTDINGGCSDMDTVEMFVLCDTCFAAIPQFVNPTCNGFSDGTIIATPIIVLSELQMDWYDSNNVLLQGTSNLLVNDTLTGIPAGTYTITITDTAAQCTADTVVTLTEPPMVVVQATNDTITCIGGAATIAASATGGNMGPYTVQWDQGLVGEGPHIVSPLGTTCYLATGVDAWGCLSIPDTVCVALMPPIIATITNTDFICRGDMVTLYATAIGGSGTGYQYTWNDGGQDIGFSDTVTVIPSAGINTYCISAIDDCETPAGTSCTTIEWYADIVPTFTADVQHACAPLQVEFTNTTPQQSVGEVVWEFGDMDGTTSTDLISSQMLYSLPGCYDITMTVTSPEGCVTTATFDDFVCADPYPTANFSFGPQPTTILNSHIYFVNESNGDSTNVWDFNNGMGTSEEENPNFEFPNEEPGTYQTTLLVANEFGCTDEITYSVVIDGDFLLYMPNAFTPNGDGINDIFGASGEAIAADGYQLTIFDRWGNQVYTSTDITEGWDGTIKGHVPVQLDVYVWMIQAVDRYYGNRHEFKGHVTLIR